MHCTGSLRFVGTEQIRQVAPIECRRGDGETPQQRGVPCFLAGDLRANEQVRPAEICVNVINSLKM